MPSEDESAPLWITLYESIVVRVSLVVALWITSGLLLYMHFQGWTSYNSFNYEVSIGLSIGFSGVTEVDSDGVHFFSTVFELAGTCLVVGSFATLVSFELSVKQPLLPPVYTLSTVPMIENGRVTLSSTYNSTLYRTKYILGAYDSESYLVLNLLLFFLTVSSITYGM